MALNGENRRRLSCCFPRRMRLAGSEQFRAVYDAKARVRVGPLMIHGRPNDVDHPRLGMAVPRKVGTAVKRNRIRRLLREALRLSQHDLPGSYDLVVNVRPHEPMDLADYRRSLDEAVQSLHRTWTKRTRAGRR